MIGKIRIIWEMPDGSISITSCKEGNRRKGESDQELIDRTADFAKPEGAKRLDDVLHSSLPSLRYSESWRNKDGVVCVDIPLARVQRMTEIRAERDKRHLQGDGPTLAAKRVSQEAGQSWDEYQQALSDIPQNTDLSDVSTPEDLEEFQPDWPEVP